MNPLFPVIELIDRLAIANIKFQRTAGANLEELDWYSDQVARFDLESVADLYKDLIRIHNEIWELESLLKTGREQELGLEEIGRRAVKIRDWNNKRIAIKNQIAEKLGCVVREIKKDHLSQ
jgi:hypothetical protein